MSELRLRKHASRARSGGSRGRDNVLVQIQRLEDTALKSSRNRSTLRHLRKPGNAGGPEKAKYPPQRTAHIGLFFKLPPGAQEEENVEEKTMKTSKLMSGSFRLDKKLAKTKDDMEDMISSVEREIVKLNNTSRSIRSRRQKAKKEKPIQSSSDVCELAQSMRAPIHVRPPERKATTQRNDSPFIEELARKIRRKTTMVRRAVASMTVSFDSQA